MKTSDTSAYWISGAAAPPPDTADAYASATSRASTCMDAASAQSACTRSASSRRPSAAGASTAWKSGPSSHETGASSSIAASAWAVAAPPSTTFHAGGRLATISWSGTRVPGSARNTVRSTSCPSATVSTARRSASASAAPSTATTQVAW